LGWRQKRRLCLRMLLWVDKAGSDVGVDSVIGGAGGNGIGPGEPWPKRRMRRREGLRGHQHRHPPASRLMRKGTVRREGGCWPGKCDIVKQPGVCLSLPVCP
jgi:hypothetical protein